MGGEGGGRGGGGITHGARAVCDGAVSQCVILSPFTWGGREAGGGGEGRGEGSRMVRELFVMAR